MPGLGEIKADYIPTGFKSTVEITRNQPELEPTGPLRVDADVAGHLHIAIILIPDFHLDDTPLTRKLYHIFFVKVGSTVSVEPMSYYLNKFFSMLRICIGMRSIPVGLPRLRQESLL
ncbi:MAG: hypothetical protein WAU91_17835 [Desulfatitalea sp.]